jgi:hypothetical protein
MYPKRKRVMGKFYLRAEAAGLSLTVLVGVSSAED